MRDFANLIALQHNLNLIVKFQEWKILNKLLILHYIEGMFDLWKELNLQSLSKFTNSYILPFWMWFAHHKISFFKFQNSNQVSHTSYHWNTKFLFIDTKMRKKRAVNANISTNVAAPLQRPGKRRPRFKFSHSGQRRPRLKFGSSGPRGGASSALAVEQGCLGGLKTQIRAWKGSADAEITVLQGRTTHRNQCINIFYFKVARL